ncbi:MAG: 30S ribosomal protein THX [Bacteroidales bacterium]
MGKGDRKTRKGKIFRNSYGKRRQKKRNKKNQPADTADNK